MFCKVFLLTLFVVYCNGQARKVDESRATTLPTLSPTQTSSTLPTKPLSTLPKISNPLSVHYWYNKKPYCPKSILPVPGFPFQCNSFSICAPPSHAHPISHKYRSWCCNNCRNAWSHCICQGYAQYVCWQKALTCLCKCSERYPCCKEL